MTKTPRWLKSVIAASTEAAPILPWARGTRRKPESFKAPAPKRRGIAAH